MSPEPHIFHLITRLIDGGAVNALVPIATEVDGFDVTVGYGSEVDQHNVEALHEAGVQTKQFPLIRHYNPVTAVGAVFTVARFIDREGFDIVHTHSTEAGIIGRAAARLAGAPHVVHTIHGVPFVEDRNDLLNWFVERCERVAARWTDVQVSIADVIAEEYLSRGIGREEQYSTIRYGIDLDEFRDAEPATDLPGTEPRVLMVGRLAEGKGFDVLLDAAERLEEDVSILIAGDGPLQSDLEKEIYDRDFGDVVHLLGYRTDIPNMMAGSDILVLPSFREGTPLVIIEAMAAGLPVIATNIAGIPELIDDTKTGYLIKPGDASTLASRVDELAQDSDQREMLGHAGQKRSNDFETGRMVSDYQSLYADLVL
ncbi:glycosyltransferase family 4 protein [Haloplanus halophilus]|uniref:glycosyltransferase family 4 protein n=1 Tax=Haloplanus halophilus TaxID=2949993 RepID=UPI00203EC792|nr:glycosyltransferase family 4 protein [Haloplanus sp. GDY1]